jgi:hypothetical protein
VRDPGFKQWVTPDRVDDRDEAFTTSTLPDLPCRRCGTGVMDYPHSICRACQEEKRRGRIPDGVAAMEPWDRPCSGEVE